MRGAAASVIPNLDAVIRMIRRTGKVTKQDAFQTNGAAYEANAYSLPSLKVLIFMDAYFSVLSYAAQDEDTEFF